MSVRWAGPGRLINPLFIPDLNPLYSSSSSQNSYENKQGDESQDIDQDGGERSVGYEDDHVGCDGRGAVTVGNCVWWVFSI